jgi:hypothetical protein
MNLILSNLYLDKLPSFLQVMKQIISFHIHRPQPLIDLAIQKWLLQTFSQFLKQNRNPFKAPGLAYTYINVTKNCRKSSQSLNT